MDGDTQAALQELNRQPSNLLAVRQDPFLQHIHSHCFKSALNLFFQSRIILLDKEKKITLQ